jgi:hypothetical protein
MRTLILIIGIITGLATMVLGQGEIKVIGEKDQMQTLFGYDSRITGYGTLDSRFSGIMDRDAVFVGAHGGVIFNSFFYFGMGAYGLATTNQITGTTPEESLDMNMGYTGLMMGFNIMPKKVVHFSVPIFVGVGHLELEHDNIFVENSAFLLVEPGLQLEINVVQFMKIGIGGGYRMVHGTNLRNPISDGDLTNWSGNFSLTFGKFR